MQSFKEVLKVKDFRYLWTSQIFSQLADRVLVALLLVNVHNLTSSKLALALPMISFGASALIFSTIAGVFVDKWRKKNILVISNLLRIILLGLFIFLPFTSQSLILIFAISFMIFTIAQIFIPAETSSIPLLIKKQFLTEANSLFMVTWMASTVVGFAFIPLMEKLNFTLPQMYLVIAVFYAIAALMAGLMHFPEYKLKQEHTMLQITKDLFMGLEFIRRKFIIKATLINLLMATTILAILSELVIDYVKTNLGLNATDFGYFVPISGIGMFLGIVTLNLKKIKQLKKGTLISCGFLIAGSTLIALAATSTTINAAILILILGVGNGLVTIPIQTIMQTSTPKSIRGRVFGVQNLIVNIPFIVSVLIAGALADLFSTGFVFNTLGILVILFGVLNLLIPKLRNI